MPDIYLFSGPCGCGETTLITVFARTLDQPAYLIHGLISRPALWRR